ncbi:glycosyltransferase family 4 protein [uncultured Halopseudomonas sp.]|uniref:glycosyltransferase family 4 protein n=1 Tax=uncultured Halopseudomonas sp. TaxID=2901193 RepID=UPI0030EC1FE7|tara:strand:- start:11665 stop:12861 length:1197 start_codon:yes stop_codon:yes gene_type:complete
MKKPSVLNINQSDLIIGGSDIYWKQLTSLLVEKGHHVKEFSSSASPTRSLPTAIDFNNPTITNALKYIYNREAKQKISYHLDSIDVAHLHIYYGKLTGSILGSIRSKQVPIVQTLHEYKLVCPIYTMHRNDKTCYACVNNKFYNCLLNSCNRGSLSRSLLTTAESYISLVTGSQKKIDAFITVSDFQKSEISKMGFPEEKLTTIHNFIDHSQHIPSNFTGEHLLYFGRVERVKGIEHLIRAMHHLRGHHGLKLLIAGTGNYLTEAQKLVDELGLGRSIKFLGRCTKIEINRLLGSCFASVTPSIWAETFGLTLIESLCEERPVIASRIGGMTEIIEEGTTGYFVSPGDTRKLAERILYLYQNPIIAERMGKAGRRSAIERFSPEAHYRKIMQVYKTVL